MNNTILTHQCENCQRLGRIAGAYAEDNIRLQDQVAERNAWLASALKVAIDQNRTIDRERLNNRMLRDENVYLRETLEVERDIRNEPSLETVCSDGGKAAQP